ncbi:B-cell receptor CD22-like [Archocentrus centrarchus]|uniref:B-cell receptor CD22-like n=1 Tax=Archocentrus centrarchus TaxID=63155 RepID=UPI0011E9BE82|nr:B-cell receptor CD22-like [Archocentrus centrarchus]
MRGAAMSLTAAATGFVAVLLSVSVVQAQDGWGVNYTSAHICAVTGSTVEMSCTYTYPPKINDQRTEVQKRLWLTKWDNDAAVDLQTDPKYAGRVKYDFNENNSTLRITDLRECDSAEYKFRFGTNKSREFYEGAPGVILSVKDAPKFPSVSVSPSAEIVEGSSVTLTCSSDANPAAEYTWYKFNSHRAQSVDQNLVLSSIQPSDSGQYYCVSVSMQKATCSGYTFIDVKYAPKLPSVSVSPSAEIVEGSSVTLTCSSDANPAANYTWYKEDEDSPKASGQNFTITDIRPEHSGSYYCVAQNTRGYQNSTVLISVSGNHLQSGAVKITAAGAAAARFLSFIVLSLILVSVFLWVRKRRNSKESSVKMIEDRADNIEQFLSGQEQPEEQDDVQYASVHFSKNKAHPVDLSPRDTWRNRKLLSTLLLDLTGAVQLREEKKLERIRLHCTPQSRKPD